MKRIIQVKGIIATVNHSLFALSLEGRAFIPHGKEAISLLDTPKLKKLKSVIEEFQAFDQRVFHQYIKNIDDNDIILIGSNTYQDAYGLFKHLIGDKDVIFIIANKEGVKIISQTSEEWKEEGDIVENFYYSATEKEETLNELKEYSLEFAEEHADSIDDNVRVHVMGGKSIYSIMKEYYSDFMSVNINIKESMFKEFTRQYPNIQFELTDVVASMKNNNFYTKNLIEKKGDISVLLLSKI